MGDVDDVEIRRIAAVQTIPLRHSVLWPNHPVEHVLLPEDDDGYHYGAFLPGQPDPVAIISVFKEPLPVDDDQRSVPAARFRKFACDPKHQGKGIGTTLLASVSRMAASEADLACSIIWCDARLATADWYERRGMLRFGETFFKYDVPYVRMQRLVQA